jgi:hypothetical protein
MVALTPWTAEAVGDRQEAGAVGRMWAAARRAQLKKPLDRDEFYTYGEFSQ